MSPAKAKDTFLIYSFSFDCKSLTLNKSFVSTIFKLLISPTKACAWPSLMRNLLIAFSATELILILLVAVQTKSFKYSKASALLKHVVTPGFLKNEFKNCFPFLNETINKSVPIIAPSTQATDLKQ